MHYMRDALIKCCEDRIDFCTMKIDDITENPVEENIDGLNFLIRKRRQYKDFLPSLESGDIVDWDLAHQILRESLDRYKAAVKKSQ